MDARARVVDAVPLHEESVLNIVRTRRQLLTEPRQVDCVVLGDFLGRKLAVVDADCRDFAVPGIFLIARTASPGTDHHHVARPEVVGYCSGSPYAVAIHGCGSCAGVGEHARHRAQRTQIIGFVMPNDALMRRVLQTGEISLRDSAAVVEHNKLPDATVSAGKENAPLVRSRSEDDLDGLVGRHAVRADGGSPVDDEPVAVLPTAVLRERQVVDAAGAGEVLPDRRVRVVRARARVVNGVPLSHQVFTLRVARAGVGGGVCGEGCRAEARDNGARVGHGFSFLLGGISALGYILYQNPPPPRQMLIYKKALQRI